MEQSKVRERRRGRAASPAPVPSNDATADVAREGSADKPRFEPPPRPEALKRSILFLYAALIVGETFFAIHGEVMRDMVPAGKYRRRDGALISIADFDPVESGPYPKCHPHNREYQLADKSWARVDSAPAAGPFPPGHPENPEWKSKWDALTKTETHENRLRWKGLQTSIHLLLLASLCVALGSKLGVLDFTRTGEDANEERGQLQVLQTEDTYWLPVLGSVALLALFIVYKYVGSEWIKFGFSCVVTAMCVHGFAFNVEALSQLLSTGGRARFRVAALDVDVALEYIVGFAGACVLAAYYISSKNWVVNNVFGLSACLMAIRKIALPGYKAGAITLIGLFFYDIFWVFGSKYVFGSNVMVTVAKGVEAPIKLMFPRRIDGCGNFEFSMLGLGDIVVPGLFVAFLAKFDAVIQGEKLASSSVYFNAAMVVYALSLITTVVVMLLFNAAQPALLYIVPYLLLASVLLAGGRKEFSRMASYVIPEDEEEATVNDTKEQ